MEKELDLTEKQQVQIDRIMTESQERIHALWEIMRPEIREELKWVRGEIEKQLDPVQRKKLEELLQQRRPKRPEEPSNRLRPHTQPDSGKSAKELSHSSPTNQHK